MKKTIRYVICEGKKAKTEKNFLKEYQRDVDFIKSINKKTGKNVPLISYLEGNNKLIFCFETIDYKKLETLLDADTDQSYLIIYVDNDIAKTIAHVTKVATTRGIKTSFNIQNKVILVHPGVGKAFEELLSYFFENPIQVYKSSKNTSKLKSYLGEDFKANPSIYKRIATKVGKKNLLNNMERYQTKKIFNLLRIRI